MTPIANAQTRRRARAWLGYAVAAACLAWVLHGVRWGDILSQARSMRWWLLVPAVAADIASYAAQGCRWSLLLRPFARISAFRATEAIYAGLFTNEVIPFRLGEILRGYLVSQWTSTTFPSVFSTIVVERFVDGIWLAASVGLLALIVPLPGYLVDAEEILAAGVILAAALFVLLVVREERHLNGRSPAAHGRFSGLIREVAAGLRLTGGAASFPAAIGLSGVYLILQIVAFWLALLAYGIGLSIWQGAAVVLILHLGTLIPSAPSNLGAYQFFTVLGLTLFGVDKTQATGFSLVVFLVLTIPLWALGGVAFGGAGLSVRRVRDDLRWAASGWISKTSAESLASQGKAVFGVTTPGRP